MDQANRKKTELRQLANKNYGQKWTNQITIPNEFQFMKNPARDGCSKDQRSKSPQIMSQNKKTKNTDYLENKVLLFYDTKLRSRSTNNLEAISAVPEPKNVAELN